MCRQEPANRNGSGSGKVKWMLLSFSITSTSPLLV